MIGWADISVGRKLTIGFGIVIALVALQGAFAMLASSQARRVQRHQVEVVTPLADAANALETAVLDEAVAARNYVLSETGLDLAAFQRAASVVGRRLDALVALPTEPDGQALVDEIVPRTAEFQQRVQTFVDLAVRKEPDAVQRAAEREAASVRHAVVDAIRRFGAVQAGNMARASAAVSDATARLMWSVAAIAALALVSAVISAGVVGRSVRRPARRIVAAANAMAAGDYAPALRLDERDALRRDGAEGAFRDELREAAAVFGRMAAVLRDREEVLAARAHLSAVLAANLSPVELATDALRAMTAHVKAEVGAIYVMDTGADEATEFHPLGTLAVDRRLAAIRVGEGIAGQAVADQRTYVVRDIAADTAFVVDLGVEALRPRCVAAIPMNVGKRVLGVLVIATVHDLSREAVAFLEESASQVAVSIDNALAHVRIEALAATLQDQNERLHGQNEELQAQGEELQSQAEELQAQTEEMQAQTEELQTQGEVLQAQSDQLRAHRDALQERNEQLAQAEAHKDRFLAVLGHELRNPLSAISAAVEVLRRSTIPGAAATARDVIARQSRQLARLLDDLLDTTRINSGKVVLARRPLDLAHVASQAVSATTAESPRHTIRVVAEPVWIDADPTRIEQIIVNLLGNAVKYTPEQGTITVSVAREVDQAVLRVIDTGIGIPDTVLPRIFEPFMQEGTTRAYGLGLGLTLVRQLVELHGGTVSATSRGRDQGTTITARFPACAAPIEFASQEGSTEESGGVRKRSVLLIEDNADARIMLRAVLAGAGHTVHEAADGPAGVAAVLAHRPDVIFVDLDLPGFDGYEVVRRLRAETFGRGLRLIALSGYGGADVRRRAEETGFDDHLVKPVDLDRVTALLRDLDVA